MKYGIVIGILALAFILTGLGAGGVCDNGTANNTSLMNATKCDNRTANNTSLMNDSNLMSKKLLRSSRGPLPTELTRFGFDSNGDPCEGDNNYMNSRIVDCNGHVINQVTPAAPVVEPEPVPEPMPIKDCSDEERAVSLAESALRDAEADLEYADSFNIGKYTAIRDEKAAELAAAQEALRVCNGN